MINFYPGPSKIYPQVREWMVEAFDSGILSMNHRSSEFMGMLGGTVKAVKSTLAIPENYSVVLTSSATECWEIISQSAFKKESYHVYNGAFGKKWFEYTSKIQDDVLAFPFPINEAPDGVVIPENADGLLCLTHCETSNGTMIPDGSMANLRRLFPGLIAVDATASMAGVVFNWEDADIWFASVQKCFGLPPGMAVMVLSERALKWTEEIGEDAHYNSLGFVLDNYQKKQTPYTPNTLGIYLLGKVMLNVPEIKEIDSNIRDRSEVLYTKLASMGYRFLVTEPQVRSATVIAVEDTVENIELVKRVAAANNIVVGNGYGQWKDTSFRIANFPAVSADDQNALFTVLNQRPAFQ